MQKTRKRKTRKRKTRKRNLFGGDKKNIKFYIAENMDHCRDKKCRLVLINKKNSNEMYISKNNAKNDDLYLLAKNSMYKFRVLFVYDEVFFD